MRTLLVFMVAFIFSLDCISQGLQFQGQGILIEDRPSYNAFEKEIPRFENHFTIEFEVSFHDLSPFGYIFLLTDKESQKEYNLIFTYKGENKSLFRLNAEGKENILSLEFKNNELDNRAWLHSTCTFYLEGDSIQISIGHQKYSAKNADLPKSFSPVLVFGKNKNSVDIPSFSLRNLRVGDKKHQYTFPLNESTGNDVHDEKGEIIGYISNPKWLINDSYYWKSRFTYHSQNVSGVNYNEEAQDLIIFNKDSLSVYNVKTNKNSVSSYANKFALSNMRLGMSFFGKGNNLFAYEVSNHSWPETDTTFAYLDNITKEWKPLIPKPLSTPLHHHAGYYDSENNRYIIFGGFGNQRYNNKFFSYTIGSNKWDTLHFSGDKITPRFYQAMVRADNRKYLYVFGGIGNESGDQTIGRHNFYDLYKVDLDNKAIKKLWNLNWTDKNVVPARNLVMLNDSLFYALCYPEYEPNSYVQLYEFSVSDGSYRILGDSIPFRSDKITTNVNLFYDKLLSEFYCVIQEFEDDGSSAIRLYSLSSPAIGESELTMYKSDDGASLRFIILLIIIILLVIGVIIYLCYRTIKHKPEKQMGPLIDDYPSPNNVPVIRKNSIYLFGEFSIYDRQGKDITYMLSTRLRYTFLIILEHSIKNDGITSHRINELLWPDKDEYSVKNLRGVTISQLRKILSELDGLELIYEKGNFKLVMSQECYCDCSRVLELINSDNNSVDELNEIKEILLRGQMLKSINEPLLNSFKIFVEEKISSILPVYLENAFDAENYLLVAHLSEILLSIDPLNETAFLFQIRSLYQLKQINEAKKKYAVFTSGYQKMMNTKYPISFSSIVKN